MSGERAASIMTAVAGGSDTIVAEATPPGRGALAVVRVTGPRSHAICASLIASFPESPRRASLRRFRGLDGEVIDELIVIRFDAPESYTGEDAVDLTTHGGSIVPAAVIAALIDAGARPALPGEFTRRAVLNGKMDLLQAEAVGDLVSATSRAAQQIALAQLDGGLSRRLLELRAALLELEALIAYDIDFPEEDDGPIPEERISEATRSLQASLGALLATAEVGEMVREGALVVLAGVPNAGKSSLFNAMVGRRRAIVSETPGTTRDAIEAVIEVGGWPVRLVDTAGLRQTNDPIEQEGVEVSYEYLARAAVILACGATASELAAVSAFCDGRTDGQVIHVRTKADLPELMEAGIATQPAIGQLAVSAWTGAGVDALLEKVSSATGRSRVDRDAPMLTRARHRVCVGRASAELAAFDEARRSGHVPAVVAAVHLRSATNALEALIGRVDVENVLDEVFFRFCVGK